MSIRKTMRRNLVDLITSCATGVRYALWAANGVFRNTIKLRTRQGVFTVSLRDRAIGRSLFATGQHEFDFSLSAVEFLKSNGFLPRQNILLLDVGANVGVICIGLMNAGVVDKAMAVEPVHENFKHLQQNVRDNHLENRIHCVNCALGRRPSVIQIELSSDNHGDHRVQAETPLIGRKGEDANRQTVGAELSTLDLIYQSAAMTASSSETLLWIDVQGFEGHVFAGGDAVLSHGVPTVAEVWPYGILRAGMTLDEYSGLVKKYWTDFWVYRNERFVRYPTTVFECFLDEVGADRSSENVVFTRADRSGATKV